MNPNNDPNNEPNNDPKREPKQSTISFGVTSASGSRVTILN